jgi:hypothetical protein
LRNTCCLNKQRKTCKKRFQKCAADTNYLPTPKHFSKAAISTQILALFTKDIAAAPLDAEEGKNRKRFLIFNDIITRATT